MSGRAGVLLLLSPLRTERAGFQAFGSSNITCRNSSSKIPNIVINFVPIDTMPVRYSLSYVGINLHLTFPFEFGISCYVI